jgi:hypothetical protein
VVCFYVCGAAKARKAAKVSVSCSEEKSDLNDVWSPEEPDAETVERKKRAARIQKDALTYHLKYMDTYISMLFAIPSSKF